jgi:hypothetical protein
MRERGRGGWHDAIVTWEQMPVEDDQWTGEDGDWDLVEDWSEEPH